MAAVRVASCYHKLIFFFFHLRMSLYQTNKKLKSGLNMPLKSQNFCASRDPDSVLMILNHSKLLVEVHLERFD